MSWHHTLEVGLRIEVNERPVVNLLRKFELHLCFETKVTTTMCFW